MAQHYIKLFTQNPLQFYYDFIAKRKARILALKAIENVSHTNSNGTAESRLKTRYELNKTIQKIN